MCDHFILHKKMVVVIAMSVENLEIPLISLSGVLHTSHVCLVGGVFAAQKPFSWSEIAISAHQLLSGSCHSKIGV